MGLVKTLGKERTNNVLEMLCVIQVCVSVIGLIVGIIVSSDLKHDDTNMLYWLVIFCPIISPLEGFLIDRLYGEWMYESLGDADFYLSIVWVCLKIFIHLYTYSMFFIVSKEKEAQSSINIDNLIRSYMKIVGGWFLIWVCGFGLFVFPAYMSASLDRNDRWVDEDFSCGANGHGYAISILGSPILVGIIYPLMTFQEVYEKCPDIAWTPTIWVFFWAALWALAVVALLCGMLGLCLYSCVKNIPKPKLSLGCCCCTCSCRVKQKTNSVSTSSVSVVIPRAIPVPVGEGGVEIAKVAKVTEVAGIACYKI